MGSILQKSRSNPITSQEAAHLRSLAAPSLPHTMGDVHHVVEGQPFCLNFLEGLRHASFDPDATLIPTAKVGCPTGFFKDIPSSRIWKPRSLADKSTDDASLDLLLCDGNWKSADDNLESAKALVASDIENKFVFPIPGGMTEARNRWPLGVAVGKLGVIKVEGKDDRLIVDSTAPHVNPGVRIQEKTFVPAQADVGAAQREDDPLSIFLTADVKAAHKRMLVLEEERGLLCFELEDQLYSYAVCHFGAAFADYWWKRMGSLIHRLIHQLVFSWHRGWLFVDDFLWQLVQSTAPLQATLVCCFLAAINCPTNWHILQFNIEVKRIGWI
jgi:hypothetical protein